MLGEFSNNLINIFFFRVNHFKVTSSAVNCQLTALDVDQVLSTDISPDSAWNIYEREFSSTCNDGGNNGGGSDPSGKNF